MKGCKQLQAGTLVNVRQRPESRKAPGAGGLLGENLEGYLSTHPLHEDRIEALAALAAERGWSTQAALVPLPE